MAGEWRGRRIATSTGGTVRPTADRVREAWMSIVQMELPDARVLDLCAGSGALGLEALSRGAQCVDFVEHDPRTVRGLQSNVVLLSAGARCTIHRADAEAFVAGLHIVPESKPPYDLAFADPPYRSGVATMLAERWLSAPFAAILGIEHAATDPLPAGGDRRVYGSTALTFFRV